MTVDAEHMDALGRALAASAGEDTFDLDRTRIAADGRHKRPTTQGVSAAELREIYYRDDSWRSRGRLKHRSPVSRRWAESRRRR